MPTTCYCLTLYLILSDFDRIYVNFPASAFGFKLQTAVETSITAHKSNELNDKKNTLTSLSRLKNTKPAHFIQYINKTI